MLSPIGSAWVFETKDGRNGLNVVLNSLPLNERLVIFERDEKWEEEHRREPKENGKSFAKKK